MLKFYYDLMSQPSRALYIFFKLNRLPVTFVKIDLMKMEHLNEEFKNVNRFQKVPCIVDDDGFKLSESVAIFRYLMASKKDFFDEHWYPSDNTTRAKIDEYLEWQHNNTRLGSAMYFQSKFLIPKITGQPINENKLKAFQKQMEGALDLLETVWLQSADKSFLATKEISFADILAACELEQPKMVNKIKLKTVKYLKFSLLG